MESGDENLSDKTAIVQQFLNTVLDHVINDVEEAKRKQLANTVHEMVIDVLRRAFTELDAEKDNDTCSAENKFTIQENLNKQETSDEEPEGNETDEESITEENVTASVPLRAECTEHSLVNKLTDIKVLDKTDKLKGKVFPKLSKVKKIKTKYGKLKIHYSDALSKEGRERIVKEDEEMLKIAKQKKLEDKKKQKEMRNKRERSFGARIGGFFRRLSCCKINPDE